MKDTIEINTWFQAGWFTEDPVRIEMIAALKQACILIDSGYLRDPDWESLVWDQKMQSKQTLFVEQVHAVLAKANL